MFTYENEVLKVTSEEENSKWETNIFYQGKLCAQFKHKESLLDPTPHKKIDQIIKSFFPKADERKLLLLEITDNFSKWLEAPEKTSVSQEAVDILCNNPLDFLLKEVGKLHPGDELGHMVYTYSLVSMNPAVGYYVHVETVGKSGGGKSHGQKICKRLLPPNMQHSIDSMSTKSLIYYAKEHSLKNKLVIIDDATEKDIEMLKHVGNNGLEPFTYSTVIDGKYTEIKADASPLIWFSRVSPLEDDGGQVSSRFLVYNIDESKEQRVRTLENIIKDDEIFISPLCKEITSACINLNIQKISCGEFKIPDSENIGYRDANFFKALIKCSALLNHKKRKISDGVLYADPEDIEAIEELWDELSRFNRHKLSEKHSMVYDLIPDDINGISSTELRVLTGIPRTSLHRITDSLEDKGLIIKRMVGRATYFFRD